jgi:transcriptional regulator with PAS, ATPase and Fis domain
LPGHQPAADAEFGTNDNLANAVELYEKSHIERTLGKTGGDKIRAADILGLSLSTLYRKIEKLAIKD